MLGACDSGYRDPGDPARPAGREGPDARFKVRRAAGVQSERVEVPARPVESLSCHLAGERSEPRGRTGGVEAPPRMRGNGFHLI